MSEPLDNSTANQSQKGLTFSEKARLFFQLPSIFHGTLIGLVLLAAKVVFYLTQNWAFVFESPYMFFSFTLLVYAIFMASRAEKNILAQEFGFGKAFFTGFRVVVVAITLSILADALLYEMDHDLPSQTIQIQIEKSVEAFKQVSFMSAEEKDKVIEELKKQKPGSFSALIGGWIGKVLANSFWLLITSLFFRYRPNRNEWLNDTQNEG